MAFGASKSPASSVHQDQVEMSAYYVGNTTSDLNLATPQAGFVGLKALAGPVVTYKDNFDVNAKTSSSLAASGSRLATGTYLSTFRDFPAIVLKARVDLYKEGLNHLRAQVIGMNATGATQTIDSQTVPAKSILWLVTDLSASDAAADLPTTVSAIVTVIGRDSTG